MLASASASRPRIACLLRFVPGGQPECTRRAADLGLADPRLGEGADDPGLRSGAEAGTVVAEVVDERDFVRRYGEMDQVVVV